METKVQSVQADTSVDEELASLEASAKRVDDMNDTGVNVSFISLASESCQALDEDNEAMYIDGLKKGEFYIQSKKANLGKDLRVIPLAFISVYNHYSDNGPAPRFIGTVSKADGDRLPVLDFTFASGKKNFSVRDCGDGSVLKPSYWVPVLLPDYPDIKDGVVTFKSTGNAVCKEWKKDVKAQGGLTASHVYVLGYQKVTSQANPKGWLLIKPVFDHNLSETGADGSVSYPDGKEIYASALKQAVAIGGKEEKNQLFIPFAPASSAASPSALASAALASAAIEADSSELEDDQTF